MANYTPSALNVAQARLIQRFQSNELKYRIPAVYLEFIRNSQIMFPNYEQLRTREDRVVTAYYKKRASRALETGRTHNHTGNVGDSGYLTPSWTTYSDKFSHSLKQANNNVFSLEEMISNDVENSMINFAEGFDTLATEYLFNNRSGVNSASEEGTFNSTQDVFEIDNVNIDRAIQIAKSVMDINKFSGNYVIFADTTAYNKFEKQANQGGGNSENLSFQFSGIRFVKAVELHALFAALGSPYTLGSWIVVPEGEIAGLPHIPKENALGVETKLSSYGMIMNPIDGLDYAIHSYETLADGTSVGGYTQDVITQFQTSLDLAFNYAPSSTANATPLLAFAIVETINA